MQVAIIFGGIFLFCLYMIFWVDFVYWLSDVKEKIKDIITHIKESKNRKNR